MFFTPVNATLKPIASIIVSALPERVTLLLPAAPTVPLPRRVEPSSTDTTSRVPRRMTALSDGASRALELAASDESESFPLQQPTVPSRTVVASACAVNQIESNLIWCQYTTLLVNDLKVGYQCR